MKLVRVSLFLGQILISSLVFSQSVIQQSVSINATGAAPAASAMLDVNSTNKGLLIPRMTAAQRAAIASPATGLLVFDTSAGQYHFYNGSTWVSLSSSVIPSTLVDTDGDTKIQVEKMPDEDIIRFDMGGTEHLLLIKNGAGIPRMEVLNSNTNTFIGEHSGVAITTGSGNTATGFFALAGNTTGNYNTASGESALGSNTIGYNNTAIGSYALHDNTSGYDNTATGANALILNTTGYANTANGSYAMNSNTTGSYNTAIGSNALTLNKSCGIQYCMWIFSIVL
jgi:hypothetical protein